MTEPFHQDQTRFGEFDKTKTLDHQLKLFGIEDPISLIEYAIAKGWAKKPEVKSPWTHEN